MSVSGDRRVFWVFVGLLAIGIALVLLLVWAGSFLTYTRAEIY